MTTALDTQADPEAAAEKDYSKLIGRRVVLTRNTTDAEDKPVAVEIKGLLENVNEFAVLIKPTGRSAVDLIELSEVEDIVAEVETPKKLVVKYLKLVEAGQARNHLLERHGATLTEVNSMTEEAAFELHSKIDHQGDDLGHVHGEKPAGEKSTGEPATTSAQPSGDSER